MESSKPSKPRVLLAIDCDHTIIDGNSDTWILSLLPDGKVPQSIKQRFRMEHKSWTIYMGEIFEYMHSMGIKEDDLRSSIASIPLTPGMAEFLEYQKSSPNVDCIVVSDSNSFFINVILKTRNFLKGINQIFTNRAEFDSEGCLRIHFSNPHTCPRKCPKNLCKQTVLRNFIAEQSKKGVTYERVCMIGDGHNDFCPCLTLRNGDFAFPRKGYSLIKLLRELNDRQSADGENEKCKATVVPWDSALEMLDVLKGLE